MDKKVRFETRETDKIWFEDNNNDISSVIIGDLSSSGSFGQIYKTSLDNTVIKKVEIKSNTGIMGILELFVLKNVKHKNLLSASLVSIRDYDTIFMLPKALCNFCEIKPLNYEELDFWCWEICQGILELHKRNILHGDIKPSNILLFELNGLRYPKICDFGMSVYLKSSEIKTKLYTPTYKPPEIWNNKVTLKSDIWAYGATLYELYYKKKYIHTCNNENLYPKIIKSAYNNIKLEEKSQLINLLLNALNENEEERYCIHDLILDDFFNKFSFTQEYIPEVKNIDLEEFENTITNDQCVINLGKYIFNKHRLICETFNNNVYISLAHKIIYNKSIYSHRGISLQDKNFEIQILKQLNYNVI